MVKNLRKLRLSQGLSQQQLADVIGTSQQSINKYENHNVEPDIGTLIKLADYFGTSVDYLIGHLEAIDGEDTEEYSKEEMSLISSYRHLTKEEQKSIRLIIKNYVKDRTV